MPPNNNDRRTRGMIFRDDVMRKMEEIRQKEHDGNFAIAYAVLAGFAESVDLLVLISDQLDGLKRVMQQQHRRLERSEPIIEARTPAPKTPRPAQKRLRDAAEVARRKLAKAAKQRREGDQ